jgi:hypothetical protein
MSSVASSGRAGQQSKVTKHHVCCTNGIGDPHIVVGDVEPGSVIRTGVDDDMTCLVIANFESEFTTGEGKKPAQTLLLFGCFCDEPGWETGRLFEQQFGVLDTVAIVLEPGMY